MKVTLFWLHIKKHTGNLLHRAIAYVYSKVNQTLAPHLSYENDVVVVIEEALGCCFFRSMYRVYVLPVIVSWLYTAVVLLYTTTRSVHVAAMLVRFNTRWRSLRVAYHVTIFFYIRLYALLVMNYYFCSSLFLQVFNIEKKSSLKISIYTTIRLCIRVWYNYFNLSYDEKSVSLF